MRSTRVFFLLLSVLQFIFFLKLVEYVRGAEIPPVGEMTLFESDDAQEENPRGLFIAPKIKRKKLRPWILGKSINQSESTSPVQVTPKIEETFEESKSEARLCPACENNECPITVPISAGFPIVPVIIAVLVGIGWFILFLIFWLFWIRPDKTSGGYAESNGGYGSLSSSYGPQDDDKGSIFDHFMKPGERSFNSYTQMTSYILDAIGKLTDIYNSS